MYNIYIYGYVPTYRRVSSFFRTRRRQWNFYGMQVCIYLRAHGTYANITPRLHCSDGKQSLNRTGMYLFLIFVTTSEGGAHSLNVFFVRRCRFHRFRRRRFHRFGRRISAVRKTTHSCGVTNARGRRRCARQERWGERPLLRATFSFEDYSVSMINIIDSNKFVFVGNKIKIIFFAIVIFPIQNTVLNHNDKCFRMVVAPPPGKRFSGHRRR